MASIHAIEGKNYYIEKVRLRGAKAKIQDAKLKCKRIIVMEKPSKINFASLIHEKKIEHTITENAAVLNNAINVSPPANEFIGTCREGSLTRDIFNNVENRVVHQSNLSHHTNFPISISEKAVDRLAFSPVLLKHELITLSTDSSKHSPSCVELSPYKMRTINASDEKHITSASPDGQTSGDVECRNLSNDATNSKNPSEIIHSSTQPSDQMEIEQSCVRNNNERDNTALDLPLFPSISTTPGQTNGPSSEEVDHPTLNDMGKKCLEAVPIIFNQLFGIPMEKCYKTLVGNQYNILTTILELQSEAVETDDTFYDESISS